MSNFKSIIENLKNKYIQEKPNQNKIEDNNYIEYPNEELISNYALGYLSSSNDELIEKSHPKSS